MLFCGSVLGQNDNPKPEGSQSPDAQQGSTTNSQQAPPTSPGQQSSPAQVQEPSTESAKPDAEQPPAKSTGNDTGAPAAKKSSVHSRAAAKKKVSSKQAGKSTNGKVVIRNGGAKDSSAQLSPAITGEQALHSRENTAQLLATTDANLKAATGRQLSPAQQSMVDQIHAYVRQSKAASVSGDLTRAHTLALKAHLLSDELARK